MPTGSGAAPPLGTVAGPALPAPQPEFHQIYFTLAELTLCAITMSTMLTQQAMLASLKVMHDSIRLESSRLAGASTVKVPEDAAAKASLRGVIRDALRAPEEWSRMEKGAEAEESLNALLEHKEETASTRSCWISHRRTSSNGFLRFTVQAKMTS